MDVYTLYIGSVCVMMEGLSYSCAAVYLQMHQFGVFPRRLLFDAVLAVWCFLTSLLFLLIAGPVGKKEQWCVRYNRESI